MSTVTQCILVLYVYIMYNLCIIYVYFIYIYIRTYIYTHLCVYKWMACFLSVRDQCNGIHTVTLFQYVMWSYEFVSRRCPVRGGGEYVIDGVH